MGRYLFIATLAFLGGHLWGYSSGLIEGAQLSLDAFHTNALSLEP
jgi:hypothetical protein